MSNLVMNLAIHFEWRTVLMNDSAYFFPAPITPEFRRRFSFPAIYRWRALRTPDEPKEIVYIAESDSMAAAMQRVISPSSRARKSDINLKLNSLFRRLVKEGRQIGVDLAYIYPFEINSIRFASNTLRDGFKRCAIQNILIAVTAADPRYELLNLVVDNAANVLQLFLQLPPRVQRNLGRKYIYGPGI